MGRKTGILKRDLSLVEGSKSYQLVGEVMAHQGLGATGPERVFPHTGTETLPRLLREAAVENLAQWTKV